ncbi:MAG: bacterial Ig-like domain-containing protein, partial [Candidatus Omnitrophota bacterium]|nr:bacterial Ig-like domain-containing protein [Candidatus Omnitrophota bacterium]
MKKLILYVMMMGIAIAINSCEKEPLEPDKPLVTLSSIVITTPATKLVYTVGEPLDFTGLKVTGIYSDGSEKVETITSANVTGFNSSAPVVGQVLTITVGDKKITYTITVQPQSISITASVKLPLQLPAGKITTY